MVLCGCGCLFVEGRVCLDGNNAFLAARLQHGALRRLVCVCVEKSVMNIIKYTDAMREQKQHTHQQFLAAVELDAQLAAQLTVGQLQILAQITAIGHQRQIAIVGDIGQLVVFALNVRHVHVVRGRTDILVLFAIENINTNHVHLGVTVLARLRCGHLDDLARTGLQHDEAVLAQGGALHRERAGRTRIAGIEVGIIKIGHCRCARWFLGWSTRKRTEETEEENKEKQAQD